MPVGSSNDDIIDKMNEYKQEQFDKEAEKLEALHYEEELDRQNSARDWHLSSNFVL